MEMNLQTVIAALITVTAISSYINNKFIKLPKSVGLTLITFCSSVFLISLIQNDLFFSSAIDFNQQKNSFLNEMDFNHTFLHGMLSFLLFAGSLHVNVIELNRHRLIILLLATVSVLLSTLLVGVFTWWLANFFGVSVSMPYCLVFGALISPTDPIAVLSIMKKVGAPKSLEAQVIGESLFNDGMGIVLFIVLINIASEQQQDYSSIVSIEKTIEMGTAFFLKQGLGGVIFGAIIGWLSSKLLQSVADYENAVLITLAVVTGGYLAAHSMDVSGVVSMAVAGLVIGSSLRSTKMSEVTLNRLDSFWELVDEVLNAVLFVLIGLESVSLSFTGYSPVLISSIVLVILLARLISVAVPVVSLSLFRKMNYGVIWLMTWGGLRGGISIALALSINLNVPERNFIVFITYIVVIFSIVVQGLTIAPMMRKFSAFKEVKN